MAMKIRKIATLLVSVCLALVVAGFPAVVNASPSAVDVGDGSIADLGSTTTVSIVLDDAPNGLSGYKITLSLSEPSIAEIVGVEFPDWATLTDNSELPADSFWMKALEAGHAVEAGATDVDLGTLTIRGDAKGSCEINVTVVDRMDDDSGNPIAPSVIPGTLRVGQYDLTISSTAGGSVTTPGEDTFTYYAGEVVDLVASLVTGYRFVNWTGEPIDGVTDPSTTITMNGNYSITANFEEIPGVTYTLTVDVSPSGGGDVKVNGVTPSAYPYTEDFSEDSSVGLKAVPGSGYEFDDWSGALSGDTNPTTITMNSNKSITANFAEIPITYYTLTVTCDPTEGGSVSPPSGDYEAGTSVELTATAAEGYAFGSWSGDLTLTGSTNPDTITMNSNKSVTANFVVFSAPGNVDVTAADPTVENIEVSTIADLGEVDTTNMPEDIEAQEAYVVDSTGTGSFTLRFTNVADASSIVVYKVTASGEWIQLTATGSGTTLEVTIPAGDPPIVFCTPTGAPAPSPGVGGTAYPINKLAILAPWIALAAAIIAGVAIFVRRRRAQS